MTGIRVSNLVKQWDDVRAVDEVSFETEQGSLTVLLGPSGCGKSTILRMIAGLEDVSAGKIEIAGQDVWMFGQLCNRHPLAGMHF